ncbi:Ornithine carbamoyltransferase, catabolic [Lactococcus lactis]|nr:Ornithine carbamoyltransferase, catabolic [Lactococcus lactis]
MFQGRSFLKETDFSKDELLYLIDFAIHLKKLKKEHIQHKYLLDKNIALIFEKTSTRTRAAFTTAAVDLGAHPEFLGPNDIQLGKKNLFQIRQRFWEPCLTALNFAALTQVM